MSNKILHNNDKKVFYTKKNIFKEYYGFNNKIYDISVKNDNDIVVVGSFTYGAGRGASGIEVLEPNGQYNADFTDGFGFTNNSIAYGVESQSDGDIVVGGDFVSYNNELYNYIIRLNSNGSIDTSFVVGDGFDNYVYDVAIQSNGKILAGGLFNTYQGNTYKRIIRLNSNGSIDTSFTTSFFGNVECIEIQSDGKILVGGNVSGNLARLLQSDGSDDSLFDIGSGFNGTVKSIGIQSNGKILAGGWFTTFTGTTQNKLIRLNSNGSKDTGFDIGSGFSGNNGAVNAIYIQSDGKILIGGNFTAFTGTTQNYIIRLNSDGSKDETFNVGSGFDSEVMHIELLSNGGILVGGNFTTYNGTTNVNKLLKLNVDGSVFRSIVNTKILRQ